MLTSIKIFVTWLTVFLVAFIVYSTCQGRIFVKSDLEKSLQWTPNYSIGLLNQNDKVLDAKLNTAEAKDVLRRSIQALEKAPLSDRPFVQLGEASIFLNSDNVDRNLFLETKKRNIRNRRALRVLVNLDANSGKFDEAVLNLDILLGLKGLEAHLTDYQNALTYLSANPTARKSIDNFLEQQAPWSRTFLSTQIELMTAVNFMDVERSLKAYMASGDNSRAHVKLNSSYLLRLMEMGRIDEGFAYWANLEGLGQTDASYTVYNPDFEKRTALAPFNWLEVDRKKYFSEIDESGGLYASFADSSERVLTQQILRLQPGAVYTFNVNADWTYRRRQGMFFWVIKCVPTNQVISEIRLDESNKETAGGAQTFQVPAGGCLHQSLNLEAKSGQYSQRIWSRTNSLNILPAQ